jgi:hypothetical protein
VPFNRDNRTKFRSEPLDQRTHASEVPKAFLTDIGRQEQIAGRPHRECIQELPKNDECCHPQGVIADAGPADPGFSTLNCEWCLTREDGIQVGCEEQTAPTPLSLPTHNHVPNRIELWLGTPLLEEFGHEARSFPLLESWRGYCGNLAGKVNCAVYCASHKRSRVAACFHAPRPGSHGHPSAAVYQARDDSSPPFQKDEPLIL